MSKHYHIAGIVPLANFKSDHKTAFPTPLLPINIDMTAIQKAVFECAMAGCQTIWIVANDDLAPIVRKTIGEYIYDPVWYARTFSKHYVEHRRDIPIYYVPIHPKDRDRRDSYGWSALYGINSAWRVAHKISKWYEPEKYFISFPYGMYDVYKIRENRPLIADMKKNFCVSHNGKTVKDGEYLSFTMFPEDFSACRKHINSLTTKTFYRPPPGEYPSKKLPLAERWSARHFDLSTVFDAMDFKKANALKADWYYNIGSWDGYCKFLGSDHNIKTPYKELLKPHRHVKLGIEIEEE